MVLKDFVSRMKTRIFFILTFALIGCSTGLHLKKSVSPSIAPDFLNQIAAKTSISDKWWEGFKDPILNSLVQQVLQNSLDLKKNNLAILVLKKRYNQEKANLYPELNIEGKVIREGKHVSTPMGGTTYSLGNTYSLTLYASYELDIFQKLSFERQAAWHQFLQNKYQYLALRQSLISETVRTYFSLVFLKQKRQLLKRILQIAREKENLARLKYQYGSISLENLLNYQNLVKQRENILLGLENSLKQTAYNLSLLLGTYPENDFSSQTWDNFSLDVLNINPGIPSELLRRRPDILAQEENLANLKVRAKIARAARFPRISLTASFGYASIELKKLFTPQSSLFNLAASILQPIFQAGKLKKEEEIAILNYRQGEIEYAKTLLTAFKEVETVLSLHQILFRQRQNIWHTLKNQEKKLELAKIKYAQGSISLLELKQTEEDYLDTLLNWEQNKLDILTNQVNLVKALGGSW